MKKSSYIILLFLNCFFFSAFAQEDLDSILNNAEEKQKIITLATFKTTRVINFHTIETVGKRTLDFKLTATSVQLATVEVSAQATSADADRRSTTRSR